MAEVTAADRVELIALYLTMFDKVPSTAKLDFMVLARSYNSSLAEIAWALSAEADFAPVASMNATDFAQYLVDSLLALDIPSSARAWALNWVTTQAQSSKTKAQIIAESVQAVLTTDNPNYASSQNELKIEVATEMAAAQAAIAAAAAAVAAAEEAAAALAVPRNFTLTASDDSFTGGTGDDSVGGLLTDLDAGDVLMMSSGNDLITITGDGVAGAAQVGSANFDLTLTANSTIDAASFSDVGSIDILPASTTATNLTVNNASYATTYGIEATGKTIGLTLNFANSAGSNDIARLNLAGVASSAINISSGNTTEVLTMATSGTNAVTLTGGTALATITITGSGTNNLTVSSSAANLTVNASSATGQLRLTAGLSSGDVLMAGTATNDRLVLGGAVDFSGTTLSGFEILDFAGGNHAVTMTLAQYNNFTSAIGFGAANTQRITLTTPGAVAGLTEDASDDMTYILANGAGNVFTAGTTPTDYKVTGGDSATTYIFGSTLTAADTVTGSTGIDTLRITESGAGSSNISAVEIFELNFAGNATFTTGAIQGSGGAKTITAAGSTGNVTLDATNFSNGSSFLTIIDGAGNDAISIPQTDANRVYTIVTLSTGGADTITITNSAFNGTTTNSLTINNFSQAAGANQDKVAGLGITTFAAVTAAGTAVAAANSLVEIETAVGTVTSFDAGNATLAETLLDTALTTYGGADGSSFYTLLYGSGGNAGKAGLYQVNVTTSATGITAANIAVELVGVFNGVTADAFDSANFV